MRTKEKGLFPKDYIENQNTKVNQTRTGKAVI
jgi:hypothetical protein